MPVLEIRDLSFRWCFQLLLQKSHPNLPEIFSITPNVVKCVNICDIFLGKIIIAK